MSDIHTIPLFTLVIDEATIDSLSGRTAKERAANAKELSPLLANGWDSAQPGQFFMRDGKPHLAAGFTRWYAFSELLKQPETLGYFVEVPDDRAQLRTIAIRSNAGKDISSVAKGQIFIQMRDGDDKDKAAVGDVILEPMTLKEIAAATGFANTYIGFCIALANSSPEVRQLLDDGEVNSNAVDESRRLCTDKTTKELDEAKQLRLLKAAIKHAHSEGKTTASSKDLDAVKLEFFPLKAATNKPAKTSEPEPDPADDEPEGDEEEKPARKSGNDGLSGGQSSLDLGSSAPPPAPKKLSGEEKKKERFALIEQFKTLLAKADQEYVSGSGKTRQDGMALDEDEMDYLAEFLVDSGAVLAESPI